jgi:hypothetical protein
LEHVFFIREHVKRVLFVRSERLTKTEDFCRTQDAGFFGASVCLTKDEGRSGFGGRLWLVVQADGSGWWLCARAGISGRD